MNDDVALTAARFGAALRGAGVPADPGRCERFARAITIAHPATPTALYLCALTTLVSDRDQIPALRAVAEMFGDPAGPDARRGDQHAPEIPGARSRTRAAPGEVLSEAARAARMHTAPPAQRTPAGEAPELAGMTGRRASALDAGEGEEAGEEGEAQAARPALASAAERLAGKDFAELSPAELALLSGLMRKLTLSVPLRRSRRPSRTPRGRHTDLRATLRQARRTGGHPVRLARRSPLTEPRQLVVLCDISGSMEPYARAMLQLLYCAAGGADAEVFTFATRLTRLTGELAHTRPALALQRAGQSAPDWLGGTRIGESIREFNDRYGRRGMARGAVVVIISDGWDTGDPAVLQHEMQRLSRVAHRIIWVNPRTQHPEYQPLAGGMAAAWPFCDAIVSGHSLHALDDLTEALSHPGRHRAAPGTATRAAAGSAP